MFFSSTNKPEHNEAPPGDALRLELRRRMARPQRHRLLQGYPMAPLMEPVTFPRRPPFDRYLFDVERPLIIGVMPHTFCNPRVKGCGFCTFPHEAFANEPARRVVAHVADEIERAVHRYETLRGRHVVAAYFGGGTANLTPPEGLERLVAALSSSFDLEGSELTFEGAPKYFLTRDEASLDVLSRAGVRHRRVSMGVQTFDEGWLRRMGREAFGGRDDVARAVEAAHRRGFTASADLLFNLPGAPLDRALADVAAAVELGFDQVCAYNLVLTPDLGTEWSRDDSLVRAMPGGAKALTTWLAVRESLLDRGYVQTTLTNFERGEVAGSPERFVYEPASFDPAAHDGVGFGPGAISTFTGRHHQSAAKWVNEPTSEGYARLIAERSEPVARVFHYSPADFRLMHLTRNLSRLSIDGEAYEGFFGTDLFNDFPSHFETLEGARLVRLEGRTVELTPEGMFYADAVAGLLAHRRTAELYREADDAAARRQPMG